MRNFKFLAFALAAMLCFSFGCAPTSKAASPVPGMEKTKILIVGVPAVGLESVRASLAGYDVIVVSSPIAPDDAFISQPPTLDASVFIDRLPEVFPNRKAPRQKQSYISRNRSLTIKPPQSALLNLKPEIVRLC